MNTKRFTMLLCILITFSISFVALGAIYKPFKHNGIYYCALTDSTVEVTKTSGIEDNWYEFYQGSVNIPSDITYDVNNYTVTEIGNQAFRGQGGLTMVVIPKTVSKICYRAFLGCPNLKSIVFASNGVLTTIEYEAFQGCAITNVTFPTSLKEVGSDAFHDCISLKSIKGGDSIETLGDNVFQGCLSLTEFTFPKSLKKIGDYAFWNCSALREVVMNEGLEEIGNDAFLECSSLENIQISNTVKKIGWEAFRWCLNLKSIVIPNSVEEMGYGVFRYCTGLERVTLSNSLKVIPAWGFEQTALPNVEIPNSVTTIGPYAFRDCANLTEIKWGNSLEKISDEAFLGTAISVLNLPEPLKIINPMAFLMCNNLKEVTIPQTTILISDQAFAECSNLKTVYNLALIPQDIPYNNNPCTNCDAPVEVHIYEGLKDLYITSIGWGVSIDNNIITLIDDIPAAKVESVVIDKDSIYCTIGETGTATATVSPSHAFRSELSWSSSDDTILYIDEFSGVYVGLAKGTVTITATATDGSGVYDSAIVYVSDDAGVNDIHIDNKPQNNTIYDLYGRKLSTPTKGINIINGKKVIIYN